MLLGRVIGNVVCTMKNASLTGQRLLIVQPLDRNGRDKGRPIVALDSVGAGAGETIYWCRGKEASFPFLPVRTARRRHDCRHRGRCEYSGCREVSWT